MTNTDNKSLNNNDEDSNSQSYFEINNNNSTVENDNDLHTIDLENHNYNNNTTINNNNHHHNHNHHQHHHGNSSSNNNNVNQKSTPSITTPPHISNNGGGAILLNSANMPVDSEEEGLASSTTSINPPVKHLRHHHNQNVLKTAAGFTNHEDEHHYNPHHNNSHEDHHHPHHSKTLNQSSTLNKSSTLNQSSTLNKSLNKSTLLNKSASSQHHHHHGGDGSFRMSSSNQIKRSTLLNRSILMQLSTTASNVLNYSMDHLVLASSSDLVAQPPIRASGAVMMNPIKSSTANGIKQIEDDGAELLPEESYPMEEIELDIDILDEADLLPLTFKEKLLYTIGNKLGMILMVGGSFLFSIMALLVNVLAKRGIQSLETAFLRSFMGLIGCLIILSILRINPLGDKSKRLYLALRGLSGTISMAAYFFTITQLPLPEAVCISFTSPVITAALAAVILKEKWGIFEGICAVLSLVGVGIISKPSFIFGEPVHDPNEPVQTNRSLYILIGIGGSFFGALSFIAVRKIGPGTNPFVLVAYFSAVASVVTLPGSIAIQSFSFPAGSEWGLLIALGVIALGAQVCVNRGIQLEKAAKAASYNYIQIIFTFMWEMMFLGGSPDILSIIGAIMILSCAVVTAFKEPVETRLIALYVRTKNGFTPIFLRVKNGFKPLDESDNS